MMSMMREGPEPNTRVLARLRLADRTIATVCACIREWETETARLGVVGEG